MRRPAIAIFVLAILTTTVNQLPLMVNSRWSLFDLRIYLTATHLVLHGNADSLYTAIFNGGWVYTYPPFSIFVFAPLELLPRDVATGLFTMASVLALARICQLLARGLVTLCNRDRSTDAALVYPLAAVMLLIASMTDPVKGTFGFGQINLLLTWLVVEDYLGLGPGESGRFGIRGLLTGIAAGIKLTPGLSWLPRLLAGQWRAAALGAIGGIGTIALSAIVLPHQTWDYFTDIVWNTNRPGDGYTEWNQSLSGMARRLVGEHGNAGAAIGVFIGVALVAGMYAATLLLRAGDLAGTVLLSAVTTYLVSPISWYHHLVLLPILVFWVAATWRTWTRPVAILLGIESLALACWTAAGLYQFVPQGNGAEFHHNLAQTILSEGVPGLSLAFVVTVAVALASREPSSPTDSTEPTESVGTSDSAG